MSRYRRLAASIVLTFAVLTSLPIAGTTLPSGFAETIVASGLASPTAMQIAPDGRIFVTEQAGRLRVIKNGTLLPTPFLTLTVDSAGERGLLGVAFDPNFATNKFVYVYYTATMPNAHNRISRFTANGDVAVAGSEVVILELNPLSGATNHNGGAIHFGEDGKLYAAVGDNTNGANSQSFTNLLGKVLRLNADGSIPSDNPFYGQAAGVNRMIWALGLRNPFTFSIEPVTARMFINDVGQNTWEEINTGVAGSNYGWPNTEGPTTTVGFRSPVYAYQHAAGTPIGCAITGGAFYNPQGTFQFPLSYDGDYFFADYCGGWIYKLETSNFTVTQFATGISSPVDLKVSDDGALYYLARGGGVVAKITYANAPPTITSHPANRTVAIGQSANFSVTASGAAPLSYQWQRNGASIAGATSSSYTLVSAQAADSGARFRATVTNPYGTATSNEATLTVTSNAAPVATITQPAAGALYSGGQTITFAGTGTDAEDRKLPASAFTWEVVFHHDTHIHPFMQPTSGITRGSFVIPTTGETASNVWYRIHLTVRDSVGLTHTTFRDVRPRTAQVTVTTSPPGLEVRIDAQPLVSPTTFTGVVGIQRTLMVVTPQTLGGTAYAFQSWSDGGSAQHTISTPASNTTYAATFAPTTSPTTSPTVVWVDDATPPGAALASAGGDTWNWVTSNPAPFSGTRAHQSALAAGVHQHYFNNATATLSVGVGDTLFAYVYLDPANPPSQVMLQWFDGTWEHRAYWGSNAIAWGINGTASRRSMGPLPAAGQWVKLSVPASQVGLEGRTLSGMAFTLYGGRATWDYAGKTTSPTVVWVDDATPPGAALASADGDTWNWVTSNPAPFSGTRAHQSALAAGVHQHYFNNATATLSVGAGDTLFAYVYLDPANPPSQVMLQWFDGTWEHRAYWGSNAIAWGINGTASRRSMGALPAAGQWVKLSVPASQVGLEGRTLSGMAFTLYGGRATWDYAGKTTSPTVVWVDDATPPGAALASAGGDTWNWVTSNPAPFSGTRAHQSALAAGVHQHYFNNATATLSVGVGDTLFAYVYLDPANPPSQVMLQWFDGTWEHRAYWGSNAIAWGINGTASRRSMGALPAAGQWVKLSVPASQVGLEGRTLSGMCFTLYGGRATWDYAGKTP